MMVEIEPFNLDWEEQDNQVIQALYDLEKDKPKELRHKIFSVNGTDWTSWTMRDHLYKKNRYPTQARGLFTSRRSDGKYTVQVRGYDKFFNINETEATQWHILNKQVQGPFEITAKENGCIIFITADTPTQLLATSKHTIPAPRDDSTSHGGMGYRWLMTHLEASHQSPTDLAAWLYKHRVTLVAELCDDEFEEHVVPYREKRGLYLHGINYNTTTLRTLPIKTVHEVAHHYGFLTVESKQVEDWAEVRRLADTIQQNSTTSLPWSVDEQGKESEGLVIRCRRQGDDFFFKVKNDIYLVYREYREVTKALLKVNGSLVTLACLDKKPKIRYEKTLYYVYWLQERIVNHPEWFYHYLDNKGVVAVRQAFEQDWNNGLLVGLDSDHLDRLVDRDSK
ncbi:RNA ligase-domain-containing protein [Chlamydoabsidia padenii]|nr:RNA ligase-domain-containing protein [Chlamydoabsidia padenii]